MVAGWQRLLYFLTYWDVLNTSCQDDTKIQMCSWVLVLLLTRKLYTMRCVFLREEGRKRVAGGWQWVTGGRKRADSWARCMSSSCRPCYWCSDSLRCWVKLLQSKHCRAKSRENVYLAPQSPKTENNTSMHTFSCCIWEVILVLSAVIQPIFRYNQIHLCCLETIADSLLGIIVLISWETWQAEVTRETFWVGVMFQRTGEDGRCVATFPYRSHLTSIIFIPTSFSGLCA